MKNLSRRTFVKHSGFFVTTLALPLGFNELSKIKNLTETKYFDVIIIGGSYSGLAAAMALGRALRKVLVIDSGYPCNRQTPHSHNFITQDGKAPHEIAALAKQQVANYDSVSFLNSLAINGSKTVNGFEIQVSTGDKFYAAKLIFASGIKDIFPDIIGIEDCWGISVLHCPYCHGYEVKNEKTGILGNGEYGIEFSKLISNWTKDLSLFTNGKSTLTPEQTRALEKHQINIVEDEIKKLEHTNGNVQNIIFKDGSKMAVKAIYTKTLFEQHCPIPEQLSCELTDEGYIKTNHSQKTSISNIYACGDNTTKMRTVANAVSMGTTAGMMLNKEFVLERF